MVKGELVKNGEFDKIRDPTQKHENWLIPSKIIGGITHIHIHKKQDPA